MKSKTLSETEDLARMWLSQIETSYSTYPQAVVVGLYGDLGSGKTTFTQAVARILGVTDHITSPTFIIQKAYETTHPLFTKLVHIDAYRLEKGEELSKLGFGDLVLSPHTLVMIEWPEKVSEILPESMEKIHFTFVDDSIRDITF